MRSKKRRLRRRCIIEIKIRGLVSLRPENTKRMSELVKVDDGCCGVKCWIQGWKFGWKEGGIKCWLKGGVKSGEE